MNIIGNMRFQSTEQQIEKAVLNLLKIKQYDSFTVKDICNHAGINRSSFYAHYQDINDLMIKIESNLTKKLQEVLKPIDSIATTNLNENPFISFFNFIKEHKIFYKAFLKSGNPSFTAPEMLKKNKSVLKQVSINKGMNYSENEIEYHLHFFGGGLKAICGYWLQNNCRETPEQMAKIIHDEYYNNAKFSH